MPVKKSLPAARNGASDACDIADGFSLDCNDNAIPDECEIFGDLDGDGVVGPADLLLLLGDWGCTECSADINCDGVAGAGDLIILLGNWS